MTKDEREGLNARIRASVEAFKALPKEQQDAMLEAQRKSWVRGEMGMGSDKDEAEYFKALREGDEEKLKRLDAEAEERVKQV